MRYPLNLSFSFSLLLMGFLLANIFGILANGKNIIFVFVFCIEIINFLFYSKFNNNKPSLSGQLDLTWKTWLPNVIPKVKNKFILSSGKIRQIIPPNFYSLLNFIFINSLNFLKIGFEFGFFIDAFKLGS